MTGARQLEGRLTQFGYDVAAVAASEGGPVVVTEVESQLEELEREIIPPG
jgi:glycine cleavage system regulatory protein